MINEDVSILYKYNTIINSCGNTKIQGLKICFYV